jgi:hypothetical protein
MFVVMTYKIVQMGLVWSFFLFVYHRICPLDLKEAISSLIFAAPRCADLPELQQVLALFSVKYGKEFVATATELRPDCGVNRRVMSYHMLSYCFL